MHIDDITSFEAFDNYEQATLTYADPNAQFALQLIVTKYTDDGDETYYIQGYQATDKRYSQFTPIKLDGLLRLYDIHDIETDNEGYTGPHSKSIASGLVRCRNTSVFFVLLLSEYLSFFIIIIIIILIIIIIINQ